MRTRLPSFGSLLLAVGLVLAGCDPTPVADAGLDAGDRDAPLDFPDAGPPCDSDEECNDGIPCTLDSCDTSRRVCRRILDNASCDDGVFCNGDERCNPLRGCEDGPRRSCDDGDVCTVDSCNETDRVCDRRPRDLDLDGDTDFFCTGGGDCDDRNPMRSSLAPEICDDTIDNDCDGSVDEPECGAPAYDTCADALDVSAGGTFVLDTRGAVADYGLACAFDNRGDLALRLTIPAGTGPRDVRISGEGDFFSVALAIRRDCVDGATELECENGFPAQIRARSLPEGTYYILVASLFGSGEVVVNVTLSEPTPPPENETCASATDVSGGGTFTSSFVDVADDTSAACGFGSSPDLFYRFRLDAPADVRINASATTGESLSWAVRTTCATPSTDFRCAYGSPATGTIHQLAAGDYFLVVEGPSYAEVDFTLAVDILPPTPPLPGDRCDAPIPLTPGTTYAGTLVGMEHDYEVSCGFRYRDAIHSFTLTSTQDVAIDVDGGTAYLNVALRPTCDSEVGQLRCDQGAPARARIRSLPAGTYYVIVEGSSLGAYTLDVTLSPPTSPVDVTGNDNCLSAVVVPETGGVYRGNTFTALPDYMTASCGFMARSKDVAFRLDLTTRRRVIANTDGSTFDTVLYFYASVCPGVEVACDDNSGEGTRSLLDVTLNSGTYYFIVDGWGTDSAGDYVFELVTLDP